MLGCAKGKLKVASVKKSRVLTPLSVKSEATSIEGNESQLGKSKYKENKRNAFVFTFIFHLQNLFKELRRRVHQRKGEGSVEGGTLEEIPHV